MRITLKRISAFILAMLIAIGMCITVSAQEEGKSVTILFTHDLHSHFLPAIDETGEEYGGYARLMTVINEQKEKHPDAILVDGGDFAMGSLFQTAYATSALELRLMGAMGYDATTFGNHEFDYLPKGLASMLYAAKESGDPLPAVVDANYLPAADDEAMLKAFEDYGVADYIVIERGGMYFVVFGIFGYDADECAPNSGMILEDPIVKAQETVDKAVKYCKDTYNAEPVVVCLSHSGTEKGEGEDYELAKGVNGIDVIISGHTHTTHPEPIQANGTYIVSAGDYGRYLGVAELDMSPDGTAELDSYELIPINDSVKEDERISALVESFKKDVEDNYLSKYGVSFDEVLVDNHIKFDTVDEVYATQHESTLCNVFSDAYKWAVETATGEEVDMALTAAGVIRESLPVGGITVSDVFNAASLGVGTEGELIKVYLTGKDLKNAIEVDASVQPLMDNAQLFCSGVEYSFNTNRMLFNEVDYAMLRNNDGTLEEIEDNKLYSVVTGMYVGQMLGAVKSKSFGLLEIVPRDVEGNPIETDELVNYVVYDKDGNALKEWYAIASYLKNMDGEMDAKYLETDGRKVVYSSLSPVKLLSNSNKFTYALIGIIFVFIIIIILFVKLIKKITKRKKK